MLPQELRRTPSDLLSRCMLINASSAGLWHKPGLGDVTWQPFSSDPVGAVVLGSSLDEGVINLYLFYLTCLHAQSQLIPASAILQPRSNPRGNLQGSLNIRSILSVSEKESAARSFVSSACSVQYA